MSSVNVQRSVLRFLTAAVAFGLLLSCSEKDKKDKRSQAACDNGLASGQRQEATLYRSDFAAFGQKCQDLALSGQVSCESGNLAYFGGVPSCEETKLEKLRIFADKNLIEIGQTIPMQLEGVDQRGAKFAVDPKLAKWSSSSSTTTVSERGLVTGNDIAADVTVSARVPISEDEELRVEYRLSVTGRNCDGTQHGVKKDFTRFKAAKVPFNAACEEVPTKATCFNGTFTFDAGVSETCSAAQVTALEADPKSLFLAAGETAPVALALVDEIGTRVPVEANSAQWEFPADQLSRENDQLTALIQLSAEVKVKVSAQNFSTEITVAPRAAQPEGLSFEQNDLVLKAGDEVELKVLSATRGQTQAVDPQRLSWESSDASKVSVTEGKVKAVEPGASVTITAKLDQLSVSTQVKVEEKLSVDAKLIEGALLTVDKPRLLPAVIATITGPAAAQAPELLNATEGCAFSVEKNRKVWELDVSLDESREEIPGVCEVELALSSPAGQQAKQKVSVPVDYRKFEFSELRSAGNEGRFEIGQLNYKLSKNLSIVEKSTEKFDQTEISPEDCTLSIEEGPGSLLLVATRAAGTSGICSGYLAVEMKKEGVERSTYHYELLVQSPEKTFLEHCQSPANSGIADMVKAIRKEVGPSSSCEKLNEVLREKNLYSAANDSTTFSLALANKKLSRLEPLARFVGLKELDLAANRDLTDLSPLSEVKLIKLLNLKATSVSDLSPIYKHKRMDDLRLPTQLRVACADTIENPELKKVCQ